MSCIPVDEGVREADGGGNPNNVREGEGVVSQGEQHSESAGAHNGSSYEGF